MPLPQNEEVTVVEELEGQTITRARLISCAGGDRLELQIAGGEDLCIYPVRGVEGDFLRFRFEPGQKGSSGLS